MWYVFLDINAGFQLTMFSQVGWTVPFIWAAVWAVITTIWVKISLKDEYAKWGEIRWKA